MHDYWRLQNGKYVVKLKQDDGLDDKKKVKNTLPPDLGAFILSNGKKILNSFIRKINGF